MPKKVNMSEQTDSFEDSLVGDVRRARAKLVEECDNDLGKLVDRLIAAQNKHPDRVVNLRKLKAQTRSRAPRD